MLRGLECIQSVIPFLAEGLLTMVEANSYQMLLMNAGHMNKSLIHGFDNTYVICFVYALSKVDLKCTTPANGPSYYRECRTLEISNYREIPIG